MHEANETNESNVGERFADAMREARARNGWSQRRLTAELEARTGVKLDPSAVTRMETGQRDVKLEEAVALARVLDIPLAAVLTGEKELLVYEAFLWLAKYGELRREAIGLVDRIADAKASGALSESRQSAVPSTNQEQVKLADEVSNSVVPDGITGFAEFVQSMPEAPNMSYARMSGYHDLKVEGDEPPNDRSRR